MYAAERLGRLGATNVTVEDNDTADVVVNPRTVYVKEFVADDVTPMPMFVQLDHNLNFSAATHTCAAMGMDLADHCCESSLSQFAVASTACISHTPGYCLRHGWNCSSSTRLPLNGSQCTVAVGANSSTRGLTGEQLRSSSDLWPLCVSGSHISVPVWFSEQAAAQPVHIESNASNASSASNASVDLALPETDYPEHDYPEPFPDVICSIVLNSRPLGAVTVSLDSGPDVRVDPNTTRFSSGDWNLARFVIVGAHDDFTAEANEERHSINVSAVSRVDERYVIGEAFTLNSTIMDNDVFSLEYEFGTATEISQGAIQLQEATNPVAGQNTGSYRLRLGSQPSAEVTVAIRVEEMYEEDVGLSDSSLTFSPANWNVYQEVILTAVDDCQDEGTEQYPETFLVINTLAAEGRDDVIRNISVSLTDDDILEEPTEYTMFNSRAGPLTGGTTIILRAVVENDDAFGTNLRAGGVSILCRFTDQYDDVVTNGFIAPLHLDEDGSQSTPGDCHGSAEINCITPEWSAEDEGKWLQKLSYRWPTDVSFPFACTQLRQLPSFS
jgi:hypothetical protein